MYEEAGTANEQEEAKESFAAAYDALQRLSQVPRHARVGTRWLDLAGLEESTIYGLGLHYGEQYHALPRLFSATEGVEQMAAARSQASPTGPDELSTPLTCRQAVSVPHSRADPRILDFDHERQAGPIDPASQFSTSYETRPRDSPDPARRNESNGRRIPTAAATSKVPPLSSRRRRKVRLRLSRLCPGASAHTHYLAQVDPELAQTLDVVVKGLHAMSRSRTPADVAVSMQRLADHVEATFQRMAAMRSAEAARNDELFRALHRMHRELATLPDRVTASEKRQLSTQLHRLLRDHADSVFPRFSPIRPPAGSRARFACCRSCSSCVATRRAGSTACKLSSPSVNFESFSLGATDGDLSLSWRRIAQKAARTEPESSLRDRKLRLHRQYAYTGAQSRGIDLGS